MGHDKLRDMRHDHFLNSTRDIESPSCGCRDLRWLKRKGEKHKKYIYLKIKRTIIWFQRGGGGGGVGGGAGRGRTKSFIFYVRLVPRHEALQTLQ